MKLLDTLLGSAIDFHALNLTEKVSRPILPGSSQVEAAEETEATEFSCSVASVPSCSPSRPAPHHAEDLGWFLRPKFRHPGCREAA